MQSPAALSASIKQKIHVTNRREAKKINFVYEDMKEAYL